MSFKKALLTLIFLIMVISMVLGTLTGCNRFLRAPEGDTSRPAGEDTIVIQTGEVACLKEAPALLQKFLDDEGTGQELDQGIGCVQESLKAFMKYTRGSKADSYSSLELQHFFNKYLLKENKVSDSFLAEIMKVKMIVVGGTAEQTSRTELDQFILFLNDVKSTGQKLQGKLKLIFFRKEQSQVTHAQILEAQQALQDVATKILDRSKVTSSRYQWVDLISFFTELNGFVGESKGLKAVLKWVPLAESVKLLFIGENAKLITDQEWRASVRWVLDTYSLILKFYYEIRHHEFNTPEEWVPLMAWLDEVLKGIETSPAMKDKKLLDAKGIDRFAEELYDLNLFKTVLNLDLVKSTYRKGLVHLIDGLPGGQGDAQHVDGLTEKQLRIFQHEYNVWKISQTFLNGVYAKNKTVTMPLLLEQSKSFGLKDLVFKIAKDSLERQDLAQSWVDYIALLATDRPLTYNTQDKVQLLYGTSNVATSYSGMSLHNFVRTITRLLLRGYGEKRSAALFSNNISEQGFIQFEEDFRDFGQKIGFLDPRNESPAKRTFKEANFFTFHGNGDAWMSPQETVEEFSLLISGGRSQASEMMEDLKKRGCFTRDLDIFGVEIVDEACFIQAFRKNVGAYFNNMMWMKDFIQKLDDNQFAVFYQNVMAVSMLTPQYHQAGRLEYAEIRTMTTILHYIESLMIVYDTNRNNMLDEKEVIAAVPRFKSFILSVGAGQVDEKYVEDVFLYLVYKGVKPTGKTDIAKLKFQRWTTGLGEVGKLNLIQILGLLKKDAK